MENILFDKIIENKERWFVKIIWIFSFHRIINKIQYVYDIKNIWYKKRSNTNKKNIYRGMN